VIISLRRAASNFPINPAELFRRDDDPVRLAPGQTVFQEGETGDCMYVVLEGSADVFVGEILVESGTPGALLEEIALADSSPRAATVVATMPARLARIDERRFHFLVQQTPSFATRDESVGGTAASYELDDEKSGGGLGVIGSAGTRTRDQPQKLFRGLLSFFDSAI